MGGLAIRIYWWNRGLEEYQRDALTCPRATRMEERANCYRHGYAWLPVSKHWILVVGLLGWYGDRQDNGRLITPDAPLRPGWKESPSWRQQFWSWSVDNHIRLHNELFFTTLKTSWKLGSLALPILFKSLKSLTEVGRISAVRCRWICYWTREGSFSREGAFEPGNALPAGTGLSGRFARAWHNLQPTLCERKFRDIHLHDKLLSSLSRHSGALNDLIATLLMKNIAFQVRAR